MTGLDHPARPGGGARPTLDDRERARRDALVGRLFGGGSARWTCSSVHLGDRLGLYRALADDGRAHRRASWRRAPGPHERYVREWLEQQAVTGILDGGRRGADAGARRYALPAGHAEVLLDRDSLDYLAPLAR